MTNDVALKKFLPVAVLGSRYIPSAKDCESLGWRSRSYIETPVEDRFPPQAMDLDVKVVKSTYLHRQFGEKVRNIATPLYVRTMLS